MSKKIIIRFLFLILSLLIIAFLAANLIEYLHAQEKKYFILRKTKKLINQTRKLLNKENLKNKKIIIKIIYDNIFKNIRSFQFYQIDHKDFDKPLVKNLSNKIIKLNFTKKFKKKIYFTKNYLIYQYKNINSLFKIVIIFNRHQIESFNVMTFIYFISFVLILIIIGLLLFLLFYAKSNNNIQKKNNRLAELIQLDDTIKVSLQNKKFEKENFL